MVLGFVLLGLPGALLMEAAKPLMVRLFGPGAAHLGDRAWPAAILISLGWPLAIAPAWLGLARLGVSAPLRWAATAGICLVWGFLLVLLCARPKKD